MRFRNAILIALLFYQSPALADLDRDRALGPNLINAKLAAIPTVVGAAMISDGIYRGIKTSVTNRRYRHEARVFALQASIDQDPAWNSTIWLTPHAQMVLVDKIN